MFKEFRSKKQTGKNERCGIYTRERAVFVCRTQSLSFCIHMGMESQDNKHFYQSGENMEY